jgi:hypothetical protein
MPVMDGLLDALHRFHREVFLPDFERVIRGAFDGLRFDWRDRFNEITDRFDRLDARAEWSLAALKRIEAQIDRIEDRIDRIEDRIDRILEARIGE